MSETENSPPESLKVPNEGHMEWLMRRIWNRVNRRNMHAMICIVGEEGSGKSYTAAKICETVDPTFNADRVFFDVAELLKVLKDGEHEPGQFYVLDEAGVQLGRRTWQDRGQVLANQALQLVRDHNLGLVFTLPRLGELDSQAQGRLQAFMEIIEKNENADPPHVVGKWFNMDPDRADKTGEIYTKYPRRTKGMDQPTVLKRVAFTPPTEDIVEKYEERKDEFQEEFYETVIDELQDEIEEQEEDEDRNELQIAEDLKEEGLENVVTEDGRSGDPMISKELVKAHEDTSIAEANTVKTLLEQELDEEELEEYL